LLLTLLSSFLLVILAFKVRKTMNVWMSRVMVVVRVPKGAQFKHWVLQVSLIFSQSNQATEKSLTDLKST
jgi:hypothetical protein